MICRKEIIMGMSNNDKKNNYASLHQATELGTVNLTFNDNHIELPLLKGTAGFPVIDINSLGTHGVYTLDGGFTSTASCKSSITYIDGQKGELWYRGFPINELAAESDFMEVCYLLLNGELPNNNQKNEFITMVKEHGSLHAQIMQFFNGFRRDAHPMAIMVGVVGALSAFYNQPPNKNPANRYITAIQLIAKMPCIAAWSYKYCIGEPFMHPNKDLDYAENFLSMMFSTPYEEYAADPVIIRAMDRIFMLHADHEQNASTTTVRVAGSTGANPFACISAGIGALWGPAHGGANEACLRMLQEIGDVTRIQHYIERAKDKNDPFRLMGFGHRVYKNYDPRAKVMRETCHEVLDAVGRREEPLFKLAMALEKIALEDPYFVEKKLYPNVDFYSGLTLSALGIPTNMFTVIFALSRTIGWISHWIEMMNDPKQRLSRPRQLYTGHDKRQFTPIDER